MNLPLTFSEQTALFSLKFGEGGSGGITKETDPTVPEWAKQPEKPKYTADEVGALSKEELPEVINQALVEAKESGQFDGAKSWNDLNDRPFYETITEGSEILPETTITFSGGSAIIPNSAYISEFVDGQQYVIEIDGVIHTAKAMYAGSPVYDYYFDTDDGLYSFAGKFDISGSHEDGDATIRIYEIVSEIKTLDSKFLTMSEGLYSSDNPVPSRVLYEEFRKKLDRNQGTYNSGKFMAVDRYGNVTPMNVPTPVIMNGATETSDGTSGLVPVPTVGDQNKVLHGDGTWKTVDMASGGGGEKQWRLLVNYESTEEVTANQGMIFDKDDAGNAFECKEILVQWLCPAASAAYATFKINGKQANGGLWGVGGYFWSGVLLSSAAVQNTFRIEALTDACFLRLEHSDSVGNQAPIWYAYDGAFDAIRSLQLTMFGGAYPIGHKFKIWGR